LARYRKAGVQIGLDDFGTGYSSMAYLRKFDIDYLKIDQTFISGIPSDEEDLAVAESIILMARRLGMRVVAEGIETAAQNTLLTAAGCDFGQGFLFSKAVPADQLSEMLNPTKRDKLIRLATSKV
jgi:EAL domain-containing protein (putative c-di-GMP-specific phosphodiesterase class I)